ncbi:MAG: carboxypeptidase regulatory-like domain-containing protein [Planctomycetota bacterium]
MRVIPILLVAVLSLGCGNDARPTPDASSPAKAEADAPRRDDGLGPTGGRVDLERVGRITGRIRFPGDAPAPGTLDLKQDSWCAENHAVFDESLVVDPAGGVAHTLVYLEGLEEWSSDFPLPEGSARLVQDGCRYEPHVLAMRAGQPLDVVNADDTSHNVHFFSRRNEEYNFTQHRPKTTEIALHRPELDIPVRCAYHPWMGARVHVFPHPAFAVTGADGRFTIEGVPPGRYRLVVRHERCRGLPGPREIEVGPGAEVALGDLDLSL